MYLKYIKRPCLTIYLHFKLYLLPNVIILYNCEGRDYQLCVHTNESV